jgi:dihydroorotase
MLPLALTLYHQRIMPLRDVIAAMTYRPADIIGVPAGRLKKGMPADLTLIDLEREWEMDPKTFVSKSQNSPFEEWKVKGRALRTVIGGESVYILGN